MADWEVLRSDVFKWGIFFLPSLEAESLELILYQCREKPLQSFLE